MLQNILVTTNSICFEDELILVSFRAGTRFEVDNSSDMKKNYKNLAYYLTHSIKKEWVWRALFCLREVHF